MDARSVDLARLIAIVAEEVMAASRRPTSTCTCHAVGEDCCPTRLQPVVDAGELTINLDPPDELAALLSVIHTGVRALIGDPSADRL